MVVALLITFQVVEENKAISLSTEADGHVTSHVAEEVPIWFEVQASLWANVTAPIFLWDRIRLLLVEESSLSPYLALLVFVLSVISLPITLLEEVHSNNTS